MSLKQRIVTSSVCSVMAVLAIVFGQSTDLKTSEQGLTHVANQEGCRLAAYQCSANRWTAGLGHTEGITERQTISLEQAANYFVEDVTKAEQVVTKAITKQANQGEFDMMVSFVFNLGAGNFKRSTLLKKFNAGQNKQACNEYLRWVYVNGKNCNLVASNCGGIVKRRETEREVCLNGY